MWVSQVELLKHRTSKLYHKGAPVTGVGCVTFNFSKNIFLFIFHRILMKKYHFGQVSAGRWHIRPPCVIVKLTKKNVKIVFRLYTVWTHTLETLESIENIETDSKHVFQFTSLFPIYIVSNACFQTIWSPRLSSFFNLVSLPQAFLI